uniref:BACK domain-containing protein n=1 Tax=Globodera pallida TaxID=36090 RepID=A0A183BWT8_GLOPA
MEKSANITSRRVLQIDQKLLREILNRDKLIINDELTIWNTALRWTDDRQNGKEPSAANRREMLDPAPFIKLKLKMFCTIFNMPKFDR